MVFIPLEIYKNHFLQKYKILKFYFLADINYTFCLILTPIILSLSPLFEFQLPRNISGTDFGTGYGGTVCGFHTRPGRNYRTEQNGVSHHVGRIVL